MVEGWNIDTRIVQTLKNSSNILYDVAQISRPQSEYFEAVAVWSDYRESKDGSGIQDER
jgi:hypothetical protein